MAAKLLGEGCQEAWACLAQTVVVLRMLSQREDPESSGRDLGTGAMESQLGLRRCWNGATATSLRPVPAQRLLQGAREEMAHAECCINPLSHQLTESGRRLDCSWGGQAGD